jgi:hypothetical protein
MPFSLSLFCPFFLHGQTIVVIFLLTLLTRFELVTPSTILFLILSLYISSSIKKFVFIIRSLLLFLGVKVYILALDVSIGLKYTSQIIVYGSLCLQVLARGEQARHQ